MSPTLTVNDLQFEVRWSPRRKTLEITVDRDGSLYVSAPDGTEVTVLEGFVREKQFWVYSKLAEKEALQHPVVVKEFVTGEGFPYLGRSYRLLLVDEQGRPLKLEAGRFKLQRSGVPRGRVHFIRWYTDHAGPWLTRRARRWVGRVGVDPTGIDVRDLGFRWGSCGQGGLLYFHWATILLPPSIIDYVLVHELVHLHEPHHTPAFWQRVERAMPDFDARKAWLAEKGAGCVAL